MAKVSGTVFRSGGKERVSYATIKAYKAGKPNKYETTDDGGEFTLDLPDRGTWTIVAFEKGSFASNPQEVDMDHDQAEIKIYMDRIAETHDEKAGKLFFWIMLGIFGLWIALYLVAHLVIVDGGKGFRIWTEDPLRYLEIVLWGVAGILVSKIFTTGWYLRNQSFLPRGRADAYRPPCRHASSGVDHRAAALSGNHDICPGQQQSSHRRSICPRDHGGLCLHYWHQPVAFVEFYPEHSQAIHQPAWLRLSTTLSTRQSLSPCPCISWFNP